MDEALWMVPYREPPPGQASDFGEVSDIAVGFQVGIATTMCFMSLFIALRIWPKFGGRDKWYLDDCESY